MSEFSSSSYEWLPSERQSRNLASMAQRVIAKATEQDDFEARGSWFETAILLDVPLSVRQQAIDQQARSAGMELQTYRRYTYLGDSANPFGPLMARVIARQGEPVQEPLAAGPEIVDIYPPADSDSGV